LKCLLGEAYNKLKWKKNHLHQFFVKIQTTQLPKEKGQRDKERHTKKVTKFNIIVIFSIKHLIKNVHAEYQHVSLPLTRYH
jgi:hypothetical protein